ncbi:hypothetical protein D7S86_23995 [Pararobbsia silviterrae]|uniref:Uncharacterized protein n=2 Tax=Pararobbsia silviterrae TaxID=1792498 RepID=A0A494X7L9_9BURK|nr:hypothetical protein D7S86_23995 [Pararobbsia silviterrae]
MATNILINSPAAKRRRAHIVKRVGIGFESANPASGIVPASVGAGGRERPKDMPCTGRPFESIISNVAPNTRVSFSDSRSDSRPATRLADAFRADLCYLCAVFAKGAGRIGRRSGRRLQGARLSKRFRAPQTPPVTFIAHEGAP